MNFPESFVWGAAAASYQIEGAAYDDGRGLSVWDMMCRQPGKVNFGDTGDVACDHYHRYQEDVDLMAEIGLQAYRLSVSWPRVLPEGIGTVNEKGLDFYSRLIDALLEKNITPWVTLFHWDFPYSLYCKGGWLNRDSTEWFAEYTALIVDKLSDRVSHWFTHNEPQCFIGVGHHEGRHAPGVQMGFGEVLLAAHNSLLAHGKSVQVIRARAKKAPLIGGAPVGTISIPLTNSPEDIEAARKDMFAVPLKDVMSNAWFSDPMILGAYPEDGVTLFEAEMPKIHEGDMKTIHQPLDFYGTNIYWGRFVRASADGSPETVFKKELPVTAIGWQITPEALYWGPRFFYERYKLPIVITENGMANLDSVQNDGQVHDSLRIDFLRQYLTEFGRAIQDGIEATGYFQWSIMDNFEWAEGYLKRFGLVHVDYETQKRTLKDSAHWYRNVISNNAV